jgi:hypothetical protein
MSKQDIVTLTQPDLNLKVKTALVWQVMFAAAVRFIVRDTYRRGYRPAIRIDAWYGG